MKTVWTDAHARMLTLLAANGRTSSEIAEAMGVDSKLIRSRAARHGITVKRSIARKFAWTAAHDAELARRYESEAAAEIARDFGCTVSAIYNRAFGLGLKKTSEFARECTRQRWAQGRHEGSRSHCFKPGIVPHNKGKAWREWNPSAEACAATQFKPGTMPYNWVPVGSYRVTSDGQLQQKVADVREPGMSRRNWNPVAVLVWEAANGPVPAGHVVRFRDGMATTDPALVTLDRVECITRRENMRRNSRHTRYPEELNQLMQLKGALNRKINNRARNAK